LRPELKAVRKDYRRASKTEAVALGRIRYDIKEELRKLRMITAK